MGVWKSIFPLYLSHWPIKALKIISLRNCEELFNYKQQLPSHSSCVIKRNKLEEKNKGSLHIFFQLEILNSTLTNQPTEERKPCSSYDGCLTQVKSLLKRYFLSLMMAQRCWMPRLNYLAEINCKSYPSLRKVGKPVNCNVVTDCVLENAKQFFLLGKWTPDSITYC